MSECVVRMEKPENCTCCPMCFTADVQGYHWCAALEQEVEQGLSRPKECPILCQLPEGHGRLIDARTVDDCFQIGCKIPTIVPADTAERSET